MLELFPSFNYIFDFVSDDPIVRPTGELKIANRRVERDRIAIVVKLPIFRTEGGSNFIATSAGAKVDGDTEFDRNVQNPRRQGFGYLSNELMAYGQYHRGDAYLWYT